MTPPTSDTPRLFDRSFRSALDVTPRTLKEGATTTPTHVRHAPIIRSSVPTTPPTLRYALTLKEGASPPRLTYRHARPSFDTIRYASTRYQRFASTSSRFVRFVYAPGLGHINFASLGNFVFARSRLKTHVPTHDHQGVPIRTHVTLTHAVSMGKCSGDRFGRFD